MESGYTASFVFTNCLSACCTFSICDQDTGFLCNIHEGRCPVRVSGRCCIPAVLYEHCPAGQNNTLLSYSLIYQAGSFLRRVFISGQNPRLCTRKARERYEIQHAIEKLDIISEKYNVKFILSVSRDESKLPECAKAKIVISL